VLEYAGQNNVSSPAAVKALRVIKYCAIAVIGFAAGAEIFIILGTSDDRAGGVFMGLLVTIGSVVVAMAAARVERVLKDKSMTHRRGG
jgi:hypothetical protein